MVNKKYCSNKKTKIVMVIVVFVTKIVTVLQAFASCIACSEGVKYHIVMSENVVDGLSTSNIGEHL
jgi:hypothetical protein